VKHSVTTNRTSRDYAEALTSNALYQRIGYVPVTEFDGYHFLLDTPEAG
jgi:predicted GNAT family acetyltransferase